MFLVADYWVDRSNLDFTTGTGSLQSLPINELDMIFETDRSPLAAVHPVSIANKQKASFFSAVILTGEGVTLEQTGQHSAQ